MSICHIKLMKIRGKFLIIRVLRKTGIGGCSNWLNI